MRRLILTILLVLAVNVFASDTIKPVKRSQYLEFARKAADWTWNNYDSLITVWEKKL